MVRKAGQVFRPRLLSLAFAAMERLRIMPQVVIAATAVAMAATFWNGALGAIQLLRLRWNFCRSQGIRLPRPIGSNEFQSCRPTPRSPRRVLSRRVGNGFT